MQLNHQLKVIYLLKIAALHKLIYRQTLTSPLSIISQLLPNRLILTG